MSVSIFDIISLMESTKPSWDELTEEQQKAYSPFMVNRFVSSKPIYLPLIADLAMYELSPKDHYTAVCAMLRKQKHYFDYKAYKNTKDKDEILLYGIEHEFKVGENDAVLYSKMLPEEDKAAIRSKWKDHYDLYK